MNFLINEIGIGKNNCGRTSRKPSFSYSFLPMEIKRKIFSNHEFR